MSKFDPAGARSFDLVSAELAFGDLLSRFLLYARESINLNHTLHLARALGKFFAFCPIEVLWEEDMGESLALFGARWTLPDLVHELSVEEIRKLIDRYRDPVKPRGLSGDLKVEVSEEGAEASIYCLSADQLQADSADSRVDRLWLIIHPPGPEIESERARKVFESRNRFFQVGRLYLELIYTSFAAIQRVPRADGLYFEIRSFTGHGGMTPAERLKEAVRFLERLSTLWTPADTVSCINLANEIAESVFHSVIGGGVDVRQDSLDSFRQELQALVANLQAFARRAASARQEEAKSASSQLEALYRALDSIACDSATWEYHRARQTGVPFGDFTQVAERELLWSLIADWTFLHQSALCHRQFIRANEEGAASQKGWYTQAHGTFGRLKDFLNLHHERWYEPSWLRLWFCHHLLSRSMRDGETWDDWYFCEHLAYAVRESLRAFRDSAGYTLIPRFLAESLRTAVEHHAVHILCLPGDPDIRGLLNEIGSPQSSLGSLYVTGHLQHALDVYIVGQFLCDVKIKIEENDEWTVEQILASRSSWKPLRLATGEFRRAFSLAALLHDVGRLLLPQWRPLAARWRQVDKAVLKSLANVEGSLVTSLCGLMTECIGELEAEGYCDTARDRAVRLWLEDRVERHEVDFPLVSAWFLHRLCQNVQGIQGDTVRQAVRAVLLHQMVTQVVEVDRDPAAALLILCDQIFTWNASSAAADVRPRFPLFETLELVGLAPEPGGKDEPLTFRVSRTEPTEKDPCELWPHFIVTLQRPESLEMPVQSVWIGMAQSLGRILPSEKHSWAPRITLRSPVVETRSGKHRTYDLLQVALAEQPTALHGALARFIAEVKPFVKIDGAYEWIEIRPLGRPLYRDDLSLLLPELERLLGRLRSDGRL